MPDGYSLSIDVTALKQADNTIKSMISNTEALQSAMSEVFGKLDTAALGMALGKLQQQLKVIEQTKVSPDFDTSKIEDAYQSLDKIIDYVETIVQYGNKPVRLFDTQHIAESGKHVWTIEKQIADVTQQITDLKKQWADLGDINVQQAAYEKAHPFVASINPRTNQPYKSGQKYDADKEEYHTKARLIAEIITLENEAERKKIESQANALNEILKGYQEELKIAKQTAAERVEVTIAAAAKELRVEQGVIKKKQAEYAKYLTEMRKRAAEITTLEGKNTDGSLSGQIGALEARFVELNNKRTALEQAYGQHLVAIAEKYNADILTIEAKRIAQKRKLEEETWQRELQTPEGALMSAQYAHTINEMKEAQKNLQAARGTVDVKNISLIKQLNDEYTRLRIAIEDLTTAEKNEKSLQPSVRNEYIRLLKEIDKVEEARERLNKTDAYKQYKKGGQNTWMDEALTATEKRLADLNKRVKDIRKQANGKLDEADRQHAADKAQREIAELEKNEAQKYAIRKKYWEQWNAHRQKLRTIDAKVADRVLTSTSSAQNVAQEENAIRRLTEARKHLNTQNKEGQTALKRINDAIEQHTHNLKMATDATYRQKQEEKKYATYDGALQFKKEAKTLNDQIRAIEYLKIARRNLNRETEGGNYEVKMRTLNKEIRRSQREVNRLEEDFKNFNSKAGDIMGQLARRFALVFSISSIEGYINRLASIRGEFEMQHRSLQVLLNSKDDADELWDKTIALAVKSPFRVKDLVTYTKQLAAYRVETEKLYSTTRMLADVSAGLGVDMNRLILAYGQVKAANFLRGTELRQFSEAGVNMLEELAEHFAEVEGRAISVSEVFERVSKRMVTFEHVDTVFRKITSEGGMFYQMQEKQSETLQGMLMNFRDSMDLMLNDIGESNEGFIKWTVDAAKTLVDNWRQVVPLITAASSALLVYAAKLAYIKVLQSTFVPSWTSLIALVAALVTGILAAVKAQSKLNYELNKINTSARKTLREQVELYHKLADTIKDVTKSEEERQQALDKLKRAFKDILPDQYLQIEYIKALTQEYAGATRAMETYYNHEARMRKKARIDQEYGQDFEKYTSALVEQFEETAYSISTVPRWMDLPQNMQEALNRVISGAPSQIDAVIEAVKKGEVAVENMHLAIIERLQKWVGDSKEAAAIIDFTIRSERGLGGEMAGLEKSARKYQAAMQSVGGIVKDSWAATEASKLLEREKKAVDDIIKSYKELGRLYTQRMESTLTPDASITAEEWDADITKAIEAAKKAYPQYANVIQTYADVFAKATNKTDLALLIDKNLSNLYSTLSQGLGARMQKVSKNLAPEVQAAVKDLFDVTQKGIKEEGAALQWTDAYENMIAGLRQIATAGGLSLNEITNFLPKLGTTMSDAGKVLLGQSEKLYEQAAAITASYSQKMKDRTNIMFNGEDVEELKKKAKVFEQMAAFVGVGPKDKHGATQQKDWYVELAKSIRDTHADYLTLHKDLSKEAALYEALRKNREAFNEAAKGAGMPSLQLDDFIDLDQELGAVAALHQVLEWIPEDATKTHHAINTLIGDIIGEDTVDKMRRNLEAINKDIDKAFGTYELSIELQEMQVPASMMESMFNVEAMDTKKLRDDLLDAFNLSYVDSDITTLDAARRMGYDENTIKVVEDVLQRVNELELKSLRDRQKKYVHYLLEGQSEVAKIRLEEARKLAEIESTFTRPEDADFKQQAIEGVRKETQEALDKQVWDLFKESEYYDMMFNDLEALGTHALKALHGRLQELSQSLNHLPPQLRKQMQQAMDDVQLELSRRNPLSGLIKAYKEYRTLVTEGVTITTPEGEEQTITGVKATEEAYATEVAKQQTLENEIAMLTQILQLQQQGVTLSQEQRDILADEGIVVHDNRPQKEINDEIAKTIKLKKEEKKQTDANVKGLGTQVTGQQAAKKAIEENKRLVGEWAQAFNDVLGGTDALLDSIGIAEDDTARLWLQNLQNIAQMIISFTAMGVAANTALGVIGWIAIALQGIATFLASIFKAHDVRLQKQIEREAAAVEKLQHAYEKLEEQISNAYSLSSVQQLNKDAQANLQEQIASTERMIELESQKKDSDSDKIKDWYAEIEEYKQAQKELEIERKKALGGIGGEADYKAASEEFVDAWLEAYRETGNGLQGLQKQFEDFFNNMIRQQLLARGVEQLMTPFYQEFDNMFADASDGGAEVTQSELDKLQTVFNELAPRVNSTLQSIVSELGVADELLNQTDTLGTLQKGIQGITEDQADIIAAFLNTIRFFVGENNTYLKTIADNYASTDVESPMLTQMRIVAQQTTAIRDLLDSITAQHPQGGQGLKVVM